MEWEASLIEWLQAHIGNLGGCVELLAFIMFPLMYINMY